MGARVRADEFGFSLEVAGHGQLIVENAVFGTLEVAGPAYLYSLRQALIRLGKTSRPDLGDRRVKVYLSTSPEAYFDHKDASFDRVSLALDHGRILVDVIARPRVARKPATVRQLLAPFLARHKASCEEVKVRRKQPPFRRAPDPDPFLRVSIDWPTKGRTVEEAWRFGKEVETLLAATQGGEITSSTLLDVLRTGRWDLLRGQPESDWLEAKGDPYDHLGDNWHLELAKDVAAFANSPGGGVIVIGITTDDRGDGDTIGGVKEFDLRRVRRQAYRNRVAQRVYPRVTGFEVERFEGSKKGRGIAALVIPPQPETSQPYLVQGVVTRGGVLGAHVLLPVRREDDTMLMDAAALHTRLRLGEQAIARPGPRR